MLALLAFSVLIPTPTHSSETILTKSQLFADLSVMREAYETLHPGLYRYVSPSEMEGHWKELERSLDRDQSLGDAYLSLSEFLAKIKCGHSYCNFFNQPKSIQSELFESGANRVPFHFRWLDGSMIVTEDRTASQSLPRGTQVHQINGLPVNQVLRKLMQIARADGSNDSKRVRYLEVSGGSRYEPFDIFFPLYFPHAMDAFELLVTLPEAKESSRVIVPGLTHAQRIATKTDVDPDPNGPKWTITRHATGVAVLRMPSWALFNTTWDWEEWTNEQVNLLVGDQVSGLIVDLRGNEGGLDCGDPLLSRLASANLPIGQTERFCTFVKTPDRLNPFLDTWDDAFRSLGTLGTESTRPTLINESPQTFYRLPNADTSSVIVSKGPRYEGKVVVLVDAACSSATFGFAAKVKKSGVATLIGETTGGNQRGINGGYFFFLRLPNSKIEMDIPLTATFPLLAERVPDAGIEPEIFVPTTMEDIVVGRDPQMARALQFLRAGS